MPMPIRGREVPASKTAPNPVPAQPTALSAPPRRHAPLPLALLCLPFLPFFVFGIARGAQVAQHILITRFPQPSPRENALRRWRENPTDTGACLALADLSSPGEAIRLLQQETARAPDDPRITTALGDKLAEQRRFAQAAAAYRTSARLAPNDSAVLVRLGQSLLRSHCHTDRNTLTARSDLQEATLALEHGAHLSPERADCWFYLGSAYARSGQPDRAREAWSNAVARDTAGDFRERANIHLHGLPRHLIAANSR